MVLELLQEPYGRFYNFEAPWSVRQLEKICQEEEIAMPGAGEA
jgi:hypothetical protein